MTGQWFSPGTPVPSTNKADHDITEILLNTINQAKLQCTRGQIEEYSILFFLIQFFLIKFKILVI